MSSNQKFIDFSKELIASVDARDGLLMQQKMDALELAYKNEFPDRLGCYEDVFAYEERGGRVHFRTCPGGSDSVLWELSRGSKHPTPF